MKHHLLSIYQPDGERRRARVPREGHAGRRRRSSMRPRPPASGSSTAACTRRTAATVLRVQAARCSTDGPYAEGKEHIGGFMVIKAPDLDVALEWGRKLARASPLPIEVRPFREDVAKAGSLPSTRPSEIERVFREEYGRAVAVLVRRFGDIDLAGGGGSGCVRVALERWPSAGCRPARRAGSSPRLATARSTACGARRLGTTGRAPGREHRLQHQARTRRARAGRSTASDLHLLSSRARARRRSR